MIQWIIDYFKWVGDVFNSIFGWISSIFTNLVNWVDSLLSGVEWFNSLGAFFPAFQIITSAIGIAFAATIFLKVINR